MTQVVMGEGIPADSFSKQEKNIETTCSQTFSRSSTMGPKQENPCHVDQRLGAGWKRSSPRAVCVELIFSKQTTSCFTTTPLVLTHRLLLFCF